MNLVPASPFQRSAPVPSCDLQFDEMRAVQWLPHENASLLAFLPTRLRFPLIGPALNIAQIRAAELPFRAADGVVGWGEKPLARIARQLARARRLPYWTLEDGFLRSAGLGKTGAPTVSIIADDIGIYFDASRPSRLELLLQSGIASRDISRSRALQRQIIEHRLTKYNHLPDHPLSLAPGTGRRILLIDQVAGDCSVAGSGSDGQTFQRMWHEARAVPGATLLIKSHPDITAGLAKGYLSHLAGEANVHFIAEHLSPHALLDRVDEVWTVSSQFGLDALIRAVPVTTFGVPFYAGWGLTTDRAEGPIAEAAFSRRTCRPDLDTFMAAALLHYPRYVDPVTQKPTTAEKAIERLVAWRHHALARRGNYLCIGFSKHKRPIVRRFLEGPWSNVHFTAEPPSRAELARADYIVRWGHHDTAAPIAAETPGTVPVLRMEDGFIRSAGLGSHFTPASSLCLDGDGIYFDATHESGLERLLLNTEFSPALLHRAARLRQRIIECGITKYNLPTMQAPDYPKLANGRPIILVAGQVPGDASLRLGLTNCISGTELLKTVRTQRPDAFIVFKEHPDLLAGKRGALSDPDTLRHLSDLVVGNVPLDPLLSICDEVHVATSQIGFEALIRGRPVWCHGLPFYAGWGLTHDRISPPRPRRQLTLEALIAGTLILYPLYLSGRTKLICEVEDVIEELHGGRPMRRPFLKTTMRRMGWGS